MDKLLEQVAQTLKIPTDALQTVINNYPLIRQEYAIYKALGVVNDTLWAAVLVNAIISGLLAIIIILPPNEELPEEEYKKLLKFKQTSQKALFISIATLIISIIVISACGIASAFLAPDIHLVKDLLNR